MGGRDTVLKSSVTEAARNRSKNLSRKTYNGKCLATMASESKVTKSSTNILIYSKPFAPFY